MQELACSPPSGGCADSRGGVPSADDVQQAQLREWRLGAGRHALWARRTAQLMLTLLCFLGWRWMAVDGGGDVGRGNASGCAAPAGRRRYVGSLCSSASRSARRPRPRAQVGPSSLHCSGGRLVSPMAPVNGVAWSWRGRGRGSWLRSRGCCVGACCAAVGSGASVVKCHAPSGPSSSKPHPSVGSAGWRW